jgi:hypothetical protein
MVLGRSIEAAERLMLQKPRSTPPSSPSSSEESGQGRDLVEQSGPDESGRTSGGGKISDNSHEVARERLVSDLNSLRRAAGNPSLGHLVKLSQHRLSKSTLDDHLKGQRSRLPPWRLVSAFVSACHEAAASTGLDVGRLGTLDEWMSVYKAAVEGKFWASPFKSPGDTMFFDTSSLNAI